jgi:plastocyanin
MTFTKFLLPALIVAAGVTALAQPYPQAQAAYKEHAGPVVQVVALDECDPATFNAALGAGFCKNVALGALGFATTLPDLFGKAAARTPDRGWDFEPDMLKVKEGTVLLVTNQGGEPHTFTEVKKFGGGFVDGLNGGEQPVSECAGGFKSVEVAKTRLLQGSNVAITDLERGKHQYQCCIHPWMRMTVEVK